MNGPPIRKIKPATKKKLSLPKIKAVAKTAVKPAKKFIVEKWDGSSAGEKIIIYADTGMGKTTLVSMAPKPVFLGLDAGGRKLKHPITGELLKHIPEIETYQDVRDAVHQPGLFIDHDTIVIDTVTILQDWAIPHMLATIPTEKGGTARNIVAYGYNKGYQHLYDLMKFILTDCDVLVNSGKNVILVAQAAPNRVSNPAGEDYLRDGPRLYAGKPSIEALYCEWSDNIFRIDYQDVWAEDKKITGDTTRAIFTKPETYFRAKSKAIDEAVVSFADKTDDSIWKYLFGE